MNKRDSSKIKVIGRVSANSVSSGTVRSNLPLSHLDRREFLRVSALGTAGATLSFAPGHFSDNIIEEWNPDRPLVALGNALRVQPVLMYRVQTKKEQTSWRSWGDVITEQSAVEEAQRITRELSDLSARSDFPLQILPVIKVQTIDEAKKIHSNDFDVILLYPATGSGQLLLECCSGKGNNIIFVRHQSGYVYYWYEALSTAYLKSNIPERQIPNNDKNLHVEDVVVDDYYELLWKLRAFFGVKNFLGHRIIAIGGPGGKRAKEAPQIARDKFKWEIIDISYDAVKNRIANNLTDKRLISKAEKLTDIYLAISNTTLKTDRIFVTKAFLLYFLFKNMMIENNATALTVNGCMGTIIPMSQTTACLTLGLLNDEGYLAFCESDFVIIPAGILLRYISGKPVFMHNSTFPHNGIVTCAHCTGPRRMDGINYDPTEIMTHYESDYGAAPKVSIPVGQILTFFNPEYATNRWVGIKGIVKGNPFLQICRSQQDVEIQGNWEKLKSEARDSHWMMAYGDYLKEGEYAARRIGVKWEAI